MYGYWLDILINFLIINCVMWTTNCEQPTYNRSMHSYWVVCNHTDYCLHAVYFNGYLETVFTTSYKWYSEIHLYHIIMALVVNSRGIPVFKYLFQQESSSVLHQWRSCSNSESRSRSCNRLRRTGTLYVHVSYLAVYRQLYITYHTHTHTHMHMA